MPKNPSPNSPSEKPSLGYQIIENLIDSEDFSEVNQSMKESYDKLEALLQSKEIGIQERKKVRQALKAYDLTADLLKFLLHTKHEMLKKQKESQDTETIKKKI